MPLKQDRTSFSAANNLKTSMMAKGMDVSVADGKLYYDGSGAEMHLALFDTGDGYYRSIRFFAGSLSDPDELQPSDPALVRVWVERDLGNMIGNLPGVSNPQFTQNPVTLVWTYSVLHNGVTRSSNDNKRVDAMAKTAIKVIDSL